MKRLALLLLLVSACADELSPAEPLASQQDPLYVAATTVWPVPAAIPVCWENGQQFPAERGWVRDQVLLTWMKHTAVKFTGWGMCVGNPAGVRIRVADEGPRAEVLGRGLDGRAGGVTFNFTFENWLPANCDVTNHREQCIRAIAVHEFGHVLGFAHEQNRPDTPDGCTIAPQGPNGDTTPTTWDPDSIMNYCNTHYADGNGQLSTRDIQGARVYYGRPVDACRVMQPGEYLKPGGSLNACGLGKMTFKTNGDLVVYHPNGGEKPVSFTTNSGADLLYMQPDGNLVLYGPQGNAIWNTGTWGNPGAYLAMQNDNNLVLYKANGAVLWSAATKLPMPGNCRIMYPNQVLEKGESLLSCGGLVELKLQTTGDLTLKQGNTLLWHSNTAGKNAYAALFQNDGNFVIYDLNDKPVWATGTNGNTAARLILQADNNLVLYSSAGKALWDTNTNVGVPTGCRDWKPNKALRRGNSFASCNGKIVVKMQTDGNLVVYDNNVALWDTGTWGTDARMAMLQVDGNFVIYDSKDVPIWNSGTAGYSGTKLSLQNDANFVLYASNGAGLWASHSYFKAPTGCGRVYGRQALARGETFWACDGGTYLTYQTDGNLVLRRADGWALWDSGTWGQGGYVAVFQYDGNLVIYRLSDDAAIWSTGTHGNPNSRLDLQNDGNMVIYNAAGAAKWDTGTWGN